MKRSRRALIYGGSCLLILNIVDRYRQNVRGSDDWSKHTSMQHTAHFISGMHEPYFPSDNQRVFLSKHFSKNNFLIPSSKVDFLNRKNIQTSVKILPLSFLDTVTRDARSVVVGGPPALISSANDKNVTYINDMRQIPIAHGSAFHLEFDATSESPTLFSPVRFLYNQIKRLLIPHETLLAVEQTGRFSWQALDWVGWLLHPECWLEGARLAYQFQLLTMKNEEFHKSIFQECSLRSKNNEKFYSQLDSTTLPGILVNASTGDSGITHVGSLHVAINDGDVAHIYDTHQSLQTENRGLHFLSRSDKYVQALVYSRLVSPHCELVATKPHDKRLHPNFMSLLTSHLQRSSNWTVEDGAVRAVYVGDTESNGVVEFVRNGTQGESVFVPFSSLHMSLGSQRLLDAKNRPVVDVVSARGVSAICTLLVPLADPVQGHPEAGAGERATCPPIIANGPASDCTVLEGPVYVRDHTGLATHQGYLLRLTSGACITPNVTDGNTAHYDSTAAVGLISTYRKIFHPLGQLDVVTMWGCNRQMTSFGQTQWFEVDHKGECVAHYSHKPVTTKRGGVLVQIGAAGGGLTQAPSQPPH